jgi:hypothetical protein
MRFAGLRARMRRACRLMITSEPRGVRVVICRDRRRRRVVVGLQAQPVLAEGAGRVGNLGAPAAPSSFDFRGETK